ncbi:hypothetical protein D3C72_1589930 [compost metagenome]
MASFTRPTAPEASIDSAPTSTVGMLFMTEESTAARKPVPMAAPQTPPCANRFSSVAIWPVSPALRSP